MKILSSFTHPQIVPNLYECKKNSILKNVFNQTFSGNQFHGNVFTYCGIQRLPATLVTNIFHNSFSNQQNK